MCYWRWILFQLAQLRKRGFWWSINRVCWPVPGQEGKLVLVPAGNGIRLFFGLLFTQINSFDSQFKRFGPIKSQFLTPILGSIPLSIGFDFTSRLSPSIRRRIGTSLTRVNATPKSELGIHNKFLQYWMGIIEHQKLLKKHVFMRSCFLFIFLTDLQFLQKGHTGRNPRYAIKTKKRRISRN